jgi:hypothetical protein
LTKIFDSLFYNKLPALSNAGDPGVAPAHCRHHEDRLEPGGAGGEEAATHQPEHQGDTNQHNFVFRYTPESFKYINYVLEDTIKNS